MKYFRKAPWILCESAAFGWFMLHHITFFALAPLPLLAYATMFIPRLPIRIRKWANAGFGLISLLLAAKVVSLQLFEGKGAAMLFCLMIAAGLFAVKTPRRELKRISCWWAVLFLLAFSMMLAATLPGMRRTALPSITEEHWDLLTFYLLALAEPFSFEKSYAPAPLALSVLLIPFGAAAYFALGGGAFSMAEYPYLSVWSGVSFSAFHHIEGLILSLYCGLTGFRAACFCREFAEGYCKSENAMV